MTSTLFRIGQGYDVHAFGNGSYITLGGIRIPHGKGVVAHSDGDVLIHAICDALLGACALGDIGHHFPPEDAQWKDADSKIFLQQCRTLITQHSYSIGNIDTTVIAQQPKLKPYLSDMRAQIAACLAITEDQISIKATTTEQLGFTGRQEGIAAQAICLLHQTM